MLSARVGRFDLPAEVSQRFVVNYLRGGDHLRVSLQPQIGLCDDRPPND